MISFLKMIIIASFLILASSCGNVYKWQGLPAPVNVTDPRDIEVVEIFNSYFVSPVFEISNSDNAISIEIVESIEGDAIGYTKSNFDSSGIYSVKITIERQVYESLSLNWYKFVLLHELGHSLGAPHMNTGVMRPQSPRYGSIDKNMLGLVDWVNLNYF